MSGFPILDLVVGMIFIYFLLSIICSSLVEMILTASRIRARVLEQWLFSIFNTKVTNSKNERVTLAQEIVDHCALTALSPRGKGPAYIDARNFVSALLEKATLYSKLINPASIDEYIQSLQSTTALPEELRRTFLNYANEAKDSIQTMTAKTTGAIELFKNKIENWYDSNMQRVSGTMKTSYTRRFTFVSAIALTICLNADTIEISKYLYKNPEARARIVAKAYETAADSSIAKKMDSLKRLLPQNDTVKLTVEELNQKIKDKLADINNAKASLEESIPLGWPATEFVKRTTIGWILFGVLKLIGLFITTLAVMMGAPFWFDVLNKISNLRGNGNKPPESEKK